MRQIPGKRMPGACTKASVAYGERSGYREWRKWGETGAWKRGVMLETEYIRNLNVNYERLHLEEPPQERRFQYCMIARGGIKGLLPCSLRYIDGEAYLYYDISSKQSVAQLFERKHVSRKWMEDFLWNMQRIRQELERFLLEERHVIWHPSQIYQDVERGEFSFFYVPYYEGENGFLELLEYLVEHVDYQDEPLVEFVYKAYEQYESLGDVYLQEKLFSDAEQMKEEAEESENVTALPHMEEPAMTAKSMGQTTAWQESEYADDGKQERVRPHASEAEQVATLRPNSQGTAERAPQETAKKSLFSFFDSKRKRDEELRESYRRDIKLTMEGCAVAEEIAYEAEEEDEEEEWGRTVFMENPVANRERQHRLMGVDGELIAKLEGESVTIGKQKGEADVLLPDPSISRLHARIVQEADGYYLEDMNSTNGTYKNGLRLQPYEKRKLEEGDEIGLGKKLLYYR